jgi:hypothetical protein
VTWECRFLHQQQMAIEYNKGRFGAEESSNRSGDYSERFDSHGKSLPWSRSFYFPYTCTPLLRSRSFPLIFCRTRWHAHSILNIYYPFYTPKRNVIVIMEIFYSFFYFHKLFYFLKIRNVFDWFKWCIL